MINVKGTKILPILQMPLSNVILSIFSAWLRHWHDLDPLNVPHSRAILDKFVE